MLYINLKGGNINNVIGNNFPTSIKRKNIGGNKMLLPTDYIKQLENKIQEYTQQIYTCKDAKLKVSLEEKRNTLTNTVNTIKDTTTLINNGYL